MAQSRTYRIVPIVLAIFLLPLVPAGCTRENYRPSSRKPAGKSFSESWYRALIGGKPAGFMHQLEEKAPSGNIITFVFQRMVVSRGQEPITMEVESEIEETPEGKIVRFRLVQRMANTDATTEGVVRGSKMEITASGLGKKRRHMIEVDRRALGPFRLEQLFLEKLAQEGDTFNAFTFHPEVGRFGKVTATLGKEEEVSFPGGPRRLTLRATAMEILPGHEIKEWIDGKGEVWKLSMALPGMSMEMYRSSSAEILREKYASPPEIFFSTSVRPNRPLENPTRLSEALYRVTLKKGDFQTLGIEDMFQGVGQKIVRQESPAARVVRISKVLPARTVTRPVEAPEGMEDALAPSLFIQSDDPLIVDLSKEAAGEETDAFQTALLLERWVKDNVQFKDLKTAFASAREVAERREGDCTEHGLLLAALARAAGIPARVVSGLVYYQGSFVGHLWTEVYIDQWIPLDGTRGRGEVGPDHIAITESVLKTSTAADLFLDMIQVIGNLKIEILEEK